MPELGVAMAAVPIIVVAFVLAGFVKGVVGGGLPAIAVPIMSTAIDPAQAAALTLIPVVFTNIWLLAQGGLFVQVVRRYWLFLGLLAIGSAIGSQILVAVPPEIMKLVIGAMVIVLSPLPFLPRNWAIPARTQRWLNPVAGLGMGIVGGATVMLAPVILYFVALRIEKELFVASMGAIALSSMTPLFIGLAATRVLGIEELLLSAIVLIPSAAGMMAGTWLRRHISQRAFQIVLSGALFAVGVNLIRSSLTA